MQMVLVHPVLLQIALVQVDPKEFFSLEFDVEEIVFVENVVVDEVWARYDFDLAKVILERRL